MFLESGDHSLVAIEMQGRQKKLPIYHLEILYNM
jgi:hypothetical protein